jgi:hypothetical protein
MFFLQIISDASIKTIELERRVINIIQGKDWWAPIMVYLHHYYEPNTIVEQTRMQQRAQAYQIVDNDLYKISISTPSFAVSHWSQSISRQSFAVGFLLASNDRWCSEASVYLRSMSMILLQDKGPDAVNSSIVASTKLGHWHCRKVDFSTRQLHLCSNRSRIFHKMDGSKAAYKCELRHNKKNSSGRT